MSNKKIHWRRWVRWKWRCWSVATNSSYGCWWIGWWICKCPGWLWRHLCLNGMSYIPYSGLLYIVLRCCEGIYVWIEWNYMVLSFFECWLFWCHCVYMSVFCFVTLSCFLCSNHWHLTILVSVSGELRWWIIGKSVWRKQRNRSKNWKRRSWKKLRKIWM